jgi:hypothetical protein
VSSYPAWTPASRPGIIPLHPLTFGAILGRSFAALRQNPRVLLGFALVVQTLAYLVVLVAVVGIAWASFSRLDTLREGTDEFNAVLAGSIAVTAVAGLVLGLAAGALGVIVQGIVVIEVTHAAVAEKLTLGQLWRQLRPTALRLIGYAFLLVTAVVALLVVAGFSIALVALAAGPIAIVLTLVVLLAAVPITWWLMIKLLLAPAAIIIEHASVTGAIARSWTLTRGRFWPALGIILLISMVFGAIAQVIGIPFSFLSSGLMTIIAPTGAPGPSEIIALIAVGLLTQVVTLLLQSVAVVVQSTATAIIYIDCRMRREGLDLDLLAYVERRDAGATALADPYREHVGRVVAPRFPPTAYPPAGAPYAAPGYPYPGPGATAPYVARPGYPVQGGYPAQPAYPAQAAYPVQPAYPAQPGYPAPGAYPAQPAQATPSPYVPQPAPQPIPPQHGGAAAAGPSASPSEAEGRPVETAPTAWTAPGTPVDGTDRESPWA